MANPHEPRVSVLMPAHNYERYVAEALESALGQDYPPEEFEIVVVDDGSTDHTAEIIAELADANPGRIKLIRQQNSGQIKTVERARAQARGELLALLDADDVWLPNKLCRQVELFDANPEVALVFCDMNTIDAAGKIVSHTLYEPGEFDPNRLYARVLRTNVVYNSSLVVRAEVFREAPDTIEAWDWWLTLCAQDTGEYAYIEEPLALYRQHGENMLLGATGSKLLGLRRRQLRFQLWAFRNLELSSLTVAELADIWGGPEWFVGTAARSVGSLFVDLVEVSDQDRVEAVRARALAEQAGAGGQRRLAAELWLRAVAWNPYDAEVMLEFHEALRLAVGGGARLP
jgi:glycosyltransferase involved in cell wall biosynthesis